MTQNEESPGSFNPSFKAIFSVVKVWNTTNLSKQSQRAHSDKWRDVSGKFAT